MNVLNCLLGENLTNITYISGSGGVGEHCAFSKLRSPRWGGGRQPLPLPEPVDWFSDPLGVRVSSDSFMEWISNLRELVCRVFTNPVGIQDPSAPEWRPVHPSATD